ncbi:DMT family transporter [Candidatus Poriferisodalis sp.]|uniref:DMT family transporter n=1 Tax=Candidatus Poriferisodalis sp. TaxID=3101277 RepID=UPI003D0D74C1
MKFAPARMTGRPTGWALAALGMLLVSTDSLWVRVSRASAWDVAFVVGVLSIVLYAGIVAHTAASSWASIRSDTKPLLLAGVLGTVSQLTFLNAITHTEVPHVVAIVAAAPLLAAAVAWIVLRERTSARVAIGIALTVVGIGLVVGDSLGTPNLLGDFLALVAVAAFAVITVVWRRYQTMSRTVGLALSSAFVVVISAFWADPTTLDGRAILAMFAMGLCCNPLGRLAYSTAPKYAPAGEVALFAPVETVAGIGWAALFLNEFPTIATVIGAVVIVAGVLYGTVLRGPGADGVTHLAASEGN